MTFKHRFFGSSTGVSPAGTLNVTDWKKAGKGLLLAIGGVVVTYLVSLLPDLQNKLAFGQWTMIVVPLASTLLNLAAKYLAGGQV